jgi:Tfp pilus assembly protein PilO
MKRLQQYLAALWQFNRLIPVLLTVLLLVDVLVYAWIGYRVEPVLEERERTYIELQARARKARQVEASTLDPQQAFRQGQVDLKKFLERVPERKELSSLVGEIFTFARQSGLAIKAINYAPEKVKGQSLLEYALSFTVAGEYDQLKEFIHLVEQSGRLVAIDQLNLDTGTRDEGSVRLSIQMSTYFRTGEA